MPSTSPQNTTSKSQEDRLTQAIRPLLNLLLPAFVEKYPPPEGTSSPPSSSDVSVRKYAKADSRHEAHPLVEGFPIETFLRHLANDPANHNSIRELAKVALTGGKDRSPSNVSVGLWALHEAMAEQNHPKLNRYNLMSAADKIGLDAHTYRALKEYSQRALSQMPGHQFGDDWHWSPESFAVSAGHGLQFKDQSRSAIVDSVKRRVRELSPNSSDKDIEESIHRHHWRGMKTWRQDSATGGAVPPEEEERISLKDLEPYKDVSGRPEYLNKAEKATRYNRLRKLLSRINSSKMKGLKRYQMVAGDFLDALRRIRSSDQKAIKHTTEQIAAKLGLKPASTVDALHNSPHYSVPGVAQAIYSNASPEDIHAAAAWYGLTGNIPGMAVFHVRPDGPDMLHRFRMHGSGHDMIAKLDKAGITDRILVPHRKGFDLLIPDKGGINRDRVKRFTDLQKTELQSSRGHFKTIGSTDQARAREMFRNTITKQEQGVDRPTMRSRLKSMLVRMARKDIHAHIDRMESLLQEDPSNMVVREALAEALNELPEDEWQTDIWHKNRVRRIADLLNHKTRVGHYQIVRDNITLNNQMGSNMGGDGPLPQSEGGSPNLVYLTHDNAALCHNCVNDNIARVADEIQNPDHHDQFRVRAYAPNWENNDLYCDHCGNQIESAYGED